MYNDDDIPVGSLIKRIDDIMQRASNCLLQHQGITGTQFKLIAILYNSEKKSAKLKQLERYFNVSQATIAGIVQRLEKKGFVEAFSDKFDKRVKYIRLTDCGLSSFIEGQKYMNECEKWLISALTEEEADTLKNLLFKVYNDKKDSRNTESIRSEL